MTTNNLLCRWKIVDSLSEIKETQGFDLDIWPSIDISSEFPLDSKQGCPVSIYIWDMIKNDHK